MPIRCVPLVLLLATLPCGAGCASVVADVPRWTSQDAALPPVLRNGPDRDYEPDFRTKRGLLVQVRRHGMWLGGDFDGRTSLTGPDVITLSDTDAGQGYELGLGAVAKGDQFLLTYRQLDFDGTIGALDADVNYRAFALQVARSFRANEPVQPYVLLEFLYALADLDDASTSGMSVGDAKLRDGFGLGLGAGVAWWFRDDLALDLRAHVDHIGFSSAEGVSGNEGDIDDDVNVSSYGLSLGLSWVP